MAEDKFKKFGVLFEYFCDAEHISLKVWGCSMLQLIVHVVGECLAWPKSNYGTRGLGWLQSLYFHRHSLHV